VQSGVGGECSFCDLEGLRRSEVCLENAYAIYAAYGSQSPPAVLPGSGIIVPLEHRCSPFELSPDEWRATHDLLVAAKRVIDERWRPDGYTVGWNVGAVAGQEVPHAHLHVIPRFDDEPLAGRGIRWAIKQSINRRPDPEAPGRGLA
jgi:diadenosine tetraphosphate (Ap4A) HIT family hydrolase